MRPIALVLAAMFLAAVPSAHAGKKKQADDADADTSPTPPPPKFNVPIPVNHTAQGVNLPYFDKGKLQMYFDIAKALRTDLYHLALEDAYMQTYDEKGALDTTVFMTRSVLDLNTRIITSEVPVTVRREDFEIVGQKMVFNTQTHQGRMTGHVHMVIYNRADMSQASPTPSATPQASATP